MICGRFDGEVAAIISQAFSIEADNPIVDIGDNDTSLSITLYHGNGWKRLTASNDGGLMLREKDHRRAEILGTFISPKGTVTRTSEKLRDGQRRYSEDEEIEIPAEEGAAIKGEIQALAEALMPVAQYLITPHDLRKQMTEPAGLDVTAG